MQNNIFMKNLIEKNKELIKYCFFGAVAAIAELSSFWAMINLGKIDYWISAPISFVIAIALNYVFQRKFTFKNTYSKKHKQIAVFILISIGGLIINWVATVAYVEILSATPLLAKLGAIITAFAYNYTMNKKITFGKMK
jgi:putative flippase GtrA